MEALNVISSGTYNILYAIGGLVLLIFSIIMLRRLMKLSYKKEIESVDEQGTVYRDKNIFGLDRVVPVKRDTDSYQPISKVINWRVVVLIALMFIGIYLIYLSQPVSESDAMPSNAIIEQADDVE